ncbi:hypothetical protein [Oceanisphaera psychrotolerans]|nr:hypothetical protein [Oceanisphaera psychrotolerans]
MTTKFLPAIALLSLFAVGGVQAAELQSSQNPARMTLQSDSDGIDRLEKRMRELREARG